MSPAPGREAEEAELRYETLNYEQDGHVTVLTYARPDQRNAVSRKMNAELHDAWQRFRDDDDAFVLVITGEGDAFCAGWDLQDAADLGEQGLGAATDQGYKEGYDGFRSHVWNSPGDCGYTRRPDVFKPVIAAINGWAVAAGLENALLADIRIVAENAVFGALERRWNIVAGDGMTVRLPMVVGYARAMEMIITGRAVKADEALRIGLANEVVPEGKSLERALELAHEIAELPQGAIRTDKETMVRNVGRTYEEQLRQEIEASMSMFLRKDSHAIGAGAFKRGETPEWPNHGL
jgi:enoyl-CoA hydratase